LPGHGSFGAAVEIAGAKIFGEDWHGIAKFESETIALDPLSAEDRPAIARVAYKTECKAHPPRMHVGDIDAAVHLELQKINWEELGDFSEQAIEAAFEDRRQKYERQFIQEFKERHLAEGKAYRRRMAAVDDLLQKFLAVDGLARLDAEGHSAPLAANELAKISGNDFRDPGICEVGEVYNVLGPEAWISVDLKLLKAVYSKEPNESKSGTKTNRGKSGRREGTGYQKLDAPFVKKIITALPKHPSRRAAARAVVEANQEKINGNSFEAKVDRLWRAAGKQIKADGEK
jgi:hypothetical protein